MFRFLEFVVLRWQRLQEIHARNRQLEAELRRRVIDCCQAWEENADLKRRLQKLTTATGPADDRAEPEKEPTP